MAAPASVVFADDPHHRLQPPPTYCQSTTSSSLAPTTPPAQSNARFRASILIMRLQAALLLLASCVPSTLAIYPDEVNHVDFHHALFGLPTPQSTFFLKPSSASNASLLYTLSEKTILGAVNPRDGSLVWRQNVSRSSLPDTAAGGGGLLRASDGNNAVVSGAGDYLSSWTALDGKLIWENWFSGGSVADLELLELEDANAAGTTRDTIALIAGDNAGAAKRIDGQTGNVKWEYKDDRLVSVCALRFMVRFLANCCG